MKAGIWIVAAAIGLLARGAAADSVETSGDVLRVAIPAAAFALAWRRDDADGRKQFLKAFAGTVVTTYALKKTIDKSRPNGDDEAFPSGHAATAFAGAAFLHRRYGWRDAWPAYLLAAYVGWTRIDADEHDGWDVLAGGAIAVGWNWWLVEPRDGTKITPALGSDQVGVAFSMRW